MSQQQTFKLFSIPETNFESEMDLTQSYIAPIGSVS